MSLGILLAAVQTISWAGASIVLRRLSAEHDAPLLNGLRSLLALPVVLALVWVLGQQGGWASLDRRSLLYILGASFAGGVIGDGLYIAVLNMIGVARALPITNAYPIVTLVFSALFLNEPITVLMVVGILLVLLGASLVVRPDRTPASHAEPIAPRRLALGTALAALVAVLWGGAAVAISVGLRSTPALVVSSMRLAVVAVVSLTMVAVRGKLGDARRFRGRELGQLLLGTLLGSIGSATLFILAISYAGPSLVTTINAAVPLAGAVMSFVFLRERLSPRLWLGTLLTVGGLVLVLI